jgi:tetratricopeptide (TPR) repeat protein
MATRTARLTPLRRKLLDRLLDELLDLEPTVRAERMQALARRCPRLHRRLDALLSASLEPLDYLETLLQRAGGEVFSSLESAESVALPPGTRLGSWRLIEAVGAGGMGMVYRAERADGAFEMQAAVKLIRVGHDDRLKERLAVERRLLARLEHPNIARILDGGGTEDGQTFLVMEWVAGKDLSDCLADARSDWARCLDWFEQIARAVGHAHQRRVVHGDIKPANVRIAPDGRARLLDFGVARLVAEEAGADSEEFRALTPAFSAPEQRSGEPASTQSDVYALGVLLFWMQTGKVEWVHGSLRDALSGPRYLLADLAAVIERACADDPERRYSGVSALLRDIERIRERRPVAARPATRGYLLDRFVRRNPLAVGLGSLAALLLVAGLVGTGWQAWIADRARERAEAERDRAQQEAEKTALVSEFLVSLFENADPFRNAGQPLTARDLVEAGVAQAESLEAAPSVQADMFRALARVNRSLARHETAHEMARRSLDLVLSRPEADRSEQARAWALLGGTLASLGRYREAEQAQRNALRLTDEDDRQARARAHDRVGLALYSLGRFDDAEAAFEQALALERALDPDSAETASALNNLALVLAATERRERALSLYRESLQIRRRVLGDEHPTTTYSMTNLATLYAQMGRWDEAEAAYTEALALRRASFDPGHPAIASVLYQLGWLNGKRGRWDRAVEFYRDALALREQRLGPDHPSVGVALNALGVAVRERGDPATARAYFVRALENYRGAYGSSHHDIALVLANLGTTDYALGDFERASEGYREALAMTREELGDGHHHVADILVGQAKLAARAGNADAAMTRALEAQQVLAAIHTDPEHPRRVEISALIDSIDAAGADASGSGRLPDSG